MSRVAELRTNLVAALQSISALVELFGADQTNILAYLDSENGDLHETIRNAKGKLLVIWQARGITGRFPGLRSERFSLIFRHGQPEEVLDAIELGVPTTTTASGLALFNETIHAKYHPMSPPVMERRQFLIEQGALFDFWEIQLIFESNRLE